MDPPINIVVRPIFIVGFMIGSTTVADMMPDITTSEPGLVSATNGILIIALAGLLVIAALIPTSRRTDWRLAVGLALAYYGAITFVTQIETWYFLSAITGENIDDHESQGYADPRAGDSADYTLCQVTTGQPVVL